MLRKPHASTSKNEELANPNKPEKVVNCVEDHVTGMHRAVSVIVLTTI